MIFQHRIAAEEPDSWIFSAVFGSRKLSINNRDRAMTCVFEYKDSRVDGGMQAYSVSTMFIEQQPVSRFGSRGILSEASWVFGIT